MPNDDSPAPAEGYYPLTLWTQILRARSDGQEAEQAWRVLLERYREPIRTQIGRYLRDDPDNAAAEFLACEFPDLIAMADRSRRFRKLLGVALHNFIVTRLRRRHAVKRGKGMAEVPLDTEWMEQNPLAGTTAEDFYRALDARLALQMVERALARLRQEDPDPAAGRAFDLLIGREAHRPPDEIARELGVTGQAMKKRRFDLRRRLLSLVRQEILDVVPPEQALEELRYFARLAGIEFREKSA